MKDIDLENIDFSDDDIDKKILAESDLSDDQKKLAKREAANMTKAGWVRLREKFGSDEKINDITEKAVAHFMDLLELTGDIEKVIAMTFIFGLTYCAGATDWETLEQTRDMLRSKGND